MGEDLMKDRQRHQLNYLRSITLELRSIAQAERCEMVAYLLDMTYLEICDILRGERPIADKRCAKSLDKVA
jgi:hypothetical protein